MLEIVLVIAIFMVGFCFVSVACMMIWRHRFISQHAIKIYGQVVALSHEAIETEQHVQPIVEYQFQGQKRRFQLPVDTARARLNINQPIEVYVFQKYLDTAMAVESVERLKGISYAFAIIGAVVVMISIVVGHIYFQDGIDVTLDFNDPSFYGDLFFSVMLFFAVMRALSHFFHLFKAAFSKVPLEKNSDVVIENH